MPLRRELLLRIFFILIKKTGSKTKQCLAQ